jgi:hypothetical protein
MNAPPLHAADQMGAAAHEAAQFAHLFQYRLLAAASPSLDRAKRAMELRRALEQWPKLCRAMGKLQEAAPNIAREAHEADARTRDFVEARS